MTETLRPVIPARPPAAYIGGKRQLSAQLVDMIATVPHETYAEPFIGMGGVFLRRTTAPRAEVINDRSRDVVTLFRVLQRHYTAFMDMLKFQFTSRAEFERLMAVDPDTLTDLERAARFLYLQRLAFGGKVAGRNFGVSEGMPGRFDVMKLSTQLAEINERLAGVIIENLPFDAFLDRYDGPRVLFYLDPPYWGSEGDYGAGMFSPADFCRLAEQLSALSGMFILSINDTPEIRKIFAAFDFEEVELTYTISNTEARPARELIITKPEMPRWAPAQASLFQP